MITGVAGSIIAMSCLGCTTPKQDIGDIRLDVGPVSPGQQFRSARLTPDADPIFKKLEEPATGRSVVVGSEFGPSQMARPQDAARFRAMDLSTPLALRAKPGETLSAELSFGASAAETGLGLDFEVAPRAQIETDRAGNNVSRTGAEVRLGQNLTNRDMRGQNVKSPSWYFFVGADNEALAWNVADETNVEGMSLVDQVTVGDLQAGVAWSTPFGGHVSLGLVEREMAYSDANGDTDIKVKEQFAAFSLTVRR